MEAYSSYDDKQLFGMIAGGDEQAFTQLFHRYAPKLLPFTRKLTREEPSCRELIQETFLRIWVGREKLTGVAEPDSWIFRIAANVSISWLREKSRRELLHRKAAAQAGDAPNPVSDSLDSKELGGIIHRAVEQLPEKRKEVYRLSREKGLSHQQIADQLGISLQTVKNQIGTALQNIQEFINRETGLSVLTIFLLLRN